MYFVKFLSTYVCVYVSVYCVLLVTYTCICMHHDYVHMAKCKYSDTGNSQYCKIEI